MIEVVVTGLSDTADECVVLNLSILSKMSQRSGVVVISAMDSIVTAFEALFRSHLKLITSKQSQERAQNILRSVIRVVYIINNSAELKDQPSARFDDFYKNNVMANADSKRLYETISSSYKLNSLD